MLLLFWYNGLRKMEKAFEIIDHVADVGIVAYGTDVEELFSNAALALFSLITEPESIEEKLHLDLEVSSEGRDRLLVEWLNELIYLFDAERILFNRFDIKRLTHNELKATCYGEGFDPMKHKIKIGVKAATYHMLKLDKNGGGCKAQIILDI
jgi:SHS2 domain-containing protein